MKSIVFYSLILFTLILTNRNYAKTDAEEANVWFTADGAKHFTCPVMGGEGVVSENTTFTVVEGKKYYHCCPACQGKITSSSSKYLQNFVLPGNVVEVDEQGKHFVCPVLGNKGVVQETTVFTDYKSKRYYYCCGACKPKFEANPEHFILAEKKTDHMKIDEHHKD